MFLIFYIVLIYLFFIMKWDRPKTNVDINLKAIVHYSTNYKNIKIVISISLIGIVLYLHCKECSLNNFRCKIFVQKMNGTLF